MQTFLPSSNFKECAEILDDRRLNKQIIEALTIYNTIVENRKAWSNHPIVKMWKDYPEALAMYYNQCLCQWKGFREKNHKYQILEINFSKLVMPFWLGDERLHSSHRANLLRKDFTYYNKYGWKENLIDYENIPYYWVGIGYGKISKN